MTASFTKDRLRDAHCRFQDFVPLRPDEEKWEFIYGQFVMQAQPNVDHKLIAGNLDRLLNDALERIGADRVAIHNPAVDLRPTIAWSCRVPGWIVPSPTSTRAPPWCARKAPAQ